MKILFVQTNYPDFLKGFYAKNPQWKTLTYSQLQKLWAKEFFGSSDFYSTNIKKHNWQAKEVIANDWNLQSKWADEKGLKIVNKHPFSLSFIPESVKDILGLRGWVKKILFEQIKEFKPTVVYLFNLSLLNTTDIKKLKRLTNLVVGQIAAPLPIDQRPLEQYNLIISSFPHYVRKFKRMGINSEYLPWCFEKRILDAVDSTNRTYDLVYVGGLTFRHSKGNKTLEALSRNCRMDIWGYGEGNLPPNSSIRKHLRGQAWGKEMYKIFAKAKIVVNRHIDASQDYANNMRMFEATGMGALLVTDHKKNISEFFKPGKEVVTYKSAQDLIRKVKYYLKHPNEARRIAKAGQKKTLKEHTYKVRMKKLDEILRRYLKNEM